MPTRGLGLAADGGEADDGGEGYSPEGQSRAFQQWQQQVQADRARRARYMRPEDFDRWDMEWRKRAKQSGLNPQEVDAFMDSLWEGEEDPSWEADDRAAGYGRR